MKKLTIHWPRQWLKRTSLGNEFLAYSVRDFIVAAGFYLLAVILCLFLRHFDPDNDSSYVAMIFLLEVFLTALLTDGYLFSVLMAIFGVLSVDYIFTPPYWEISFTLAGFPVTFVVMLSISLVTATVTSRAKRRDALLREAEREKIHSNLLRAMSHDIRTPLTGIVGATNVLLEQDETLTPQQRRELLESTNEEAEWLIGMVENLLSITRINTDNAKVKKTPELAEEIIESAVRKFAKRYGDVPVEVNLPDEVLIVPMDATLMVQVLTNLMENAVLHGVTLTGITVTLKHEENQALFIVEDDGQGIAPSKMARLFDSATHATEGDKKRNMGIGLSACHTVIQAHGGAIWGENRKTGGARFVVALPLEEVKNEDQG